MKFLRTGVSAIALMMVPFASAFADAGDDVGPQEVIVTGTRQANRTIAESPVPIDVLPVADMTKTGRVGVTAILNDLLPSFNMPTVPGQDESAIVRPASLRGLSPDQTLVLVNGKRRHNTAIVGVGGTVGSGSNPVDLDYLPTSSIARIEVLRDGAAAQYGSDAIAGVINIILKKGGEGASASALYGQYKKGDGITLQVTGDAGVTFESGGWIHAAVEFRRKDHSDRSGLDLRQQYFLLDANNNPVATTVPTYTSPLPAGLHYDPREFTINRHTVQYSGDPMSRLGSFVLNGEHPFSDDITGYANVTYGHRFGKGYENFRQPRGNNTVRSIFPNGFEPMITIDEDDFQLTGGIKGKNFLGFDWDLSSTYGRNQANLGVEYTLNATYGLNSPTSTYNGAEIFGQWTNNFDLTRQVSLSFLPAPLAVAMGVEYRHESYRTLPGEPASYADGGFLVLDGPFKGAKPSPGSQSYGGLRPDGAIDKGRDAFAVYIDLDTQITPQWEVGLAGRVEQFSDFGSTASGKLSTRYEITKGVAVRGTMSNGFRAPSLAQSYFTSSSTFFFNINGVSTPVDIGYFPATSRIGKLLGGKALQPETSRSYSVGLVLTPVPKASITLDAYQIDIQDRVLLTSTIIGDQVTALLNANGIFNVAGAQYFANAADTRTRGVDFVASYQFDAGDMGQFTPSFSYNWNKTQIKRIAPTPTQLSSLGATLFDRQRQGAMVDANPQNKAIASITWSLRNFNATLREVRYGHLWYRDPSNPALDDLNAPAWITDLELSYDLPYGFNLAVGANNITDKYPSHHQTANVSSNGGNQYISYAPWGISGAFYYTRLSWRF